MDEKVFLSVKNITKVFPGVIALDNVSFDLRKGEVHAIVGENGAGKSTLMNVLGGVFKPEKGSIFLDNKEVTFRNVQEATQHGISVVFQELSLVDNLSIAENILANRQPINRAGFIKKTELHNQAQQMLDQLDIELNPYTLVKYLSMANKQIVEILKAMSYYPKILILDEPTSSLARAGVKELFRNICRLKEEGISIIYISHFLSEVFEVADRITVLRDGKFVATKDAQDVNEKEIVSLMVGRELNNIYCTDLTKTEPGEEYFRVEHLCKRNVFDDISFSLRKGEILGISGLVGSGRTELAHAIFGFNPADSGRILLEEKELVNRSVRETIRQGIGYLSEDRKNIGLFLSLNVKQNLIAPRLYDYANAGFLSEDRINDFCNRGIGDYCIVATGKEQKLIRLSGGNQQKVLFAKWMGINPSLLIIDEPTKGVDIGAKGEIYTKIRELVQTGVGVILISSDLPEILGLSDRVLVMRNGRIVAELTGSKIDEQTIMGYATGVNVSQSSKVS